MAPYDVAEFLRDLAGGHALLRRRRSVPCEPLAERGSGSATEI